jgi:hypothetical protein
MLRGYMCANMLNFQTVEGLPNKASWRPPSFSARDVHSSLRLPILRRHAKEPHRNDPSQVRE